MEVSPLPQPSTKKLDVASVWPRPSCADEATPRKAVYVPTYRAVQPVENPTQIAVPCVVRASSVTRKDVLMQAHVV